MHIYVPWKGYKIFYPIYAEEGLWNVSEKEIKLDDIIMYVACWEKCVCIIGFLFKLMLFVLGKSFKASTLPGAQLRGGEALGARASSCISHFG